MPVQIALFAFIALIISLSGQFSTPTLIEFFILAVSYVSAVNTVALLGPRFYTLFTEGDEAATAMAMRRSTLGDPGQLPMAGSRRTTNRKTFVQSEPVLVKVVPSSGEGESESTPDSHSSTSRVSFVPSL